MEKTVPRALPLALKHHMVESAVKRLNGHDDHDDEANLLMPIFGGEHAMTAREISNLLNLKDYAAKLLMVADLLTRHSTKPKDP